MCARGGIPFEVVPGVTAGVAAPAYAGIPVTHRDLASAVAFVTGHEDPAKPETALDWPALAAFPGTLVFYMGVRALPRIADAADRRRARAPTSRWRSSSAARCRGQRTLLATLGDGRRACGGRGGSARRAITLVGPVAALRERARLARAAAAARRAASTVTRARPQASALAARLRELGADGRSRRRRSATRPLDGRAAGPRRLRPGLRHVAERRARALRAARRGGAATRARWPGDRSRRSGPGRPGAARARACAPTSCPRARSPRGWSRRWPACPCARALLVRGREGRDVLPDALRARGAEVDVLALYETVAEPLADAERRRAPRTTSRSPRPRPSGSSLDGAGGRPSGRARVDRPGDLRGAARGGLRAATVEAAPHTPDGLVEALVADAAAADAPGHVPLRLRAGGRVRRRAARGDRADRAGRAGHRPRPRDPAPRRRRRRAGAGADAALRAAGRPPGGRRPGRGRARGARSRCARRTEDRLLVGPDNGLLLPAAARASAAWPRRSTISRSPWRLEPVSATFHGRDLFAPVAARLAAGAPLADAGAPLDAGDLVALELPRARGRRDGRRRGRPRRRLRQRRARRRRRDLAAAGLRARARPVRASRRSRRRRASRADLSRYGRSPTSRLGEAGRLRGLGRRSSLAVNRGDAAAALGVARRRRGRSSRAA